MSARHHKIKKYYPNEQHPRSIAQQQKKGTSDIHSSLIYSGEKLSQIDDLVIGVGSGAELKERGLDGSVVADAHKAKRHLLLASAIGHLIR